MLVSTKEETMTIHYVPAYIQIDGKWTRVGTAAVDQECGSADITISDDAPTKEALAAIMSKAAGGMSIGVPTEPVDFDEACEHDFVPRWEEDSEPDCAYCGAKKSDQPNVAKDQKDPHNPHKHNPVQHRDRKVPWCNECGLDKNHQEPMPRARIPK